MQALTSQVGVVVLDVPAASVVQNLQLILASLGDIGKVLDVRTVHIGGVGLALLVPQVVPVRGGKGDLDVLDLLGGNKAGEVFELVDIGATNVLDLAGADHALAGLVAGLEESGDIGSVVTEDIGVDLVDLFESLQTGEEGAPEHYRQSISIFENWEKAAYCACGIRHRRHRGIRAASGRRQPP